MGMYKKIAQAIEEGSTKYNYLVREQEVKKDILQEAIKELAVLTAHPVPEGLELDKVVTESAGQFRIIKSAESNICVYYTAAGLDKMYRLTLDAIVDDNTYDPEEEN